MAQVAGQARSSFTAAEQKLADAGRVSVTCRGALNGCTSAARRPAPDCRLVDMPWPLDRCMIAVWLLTDRHPRLAGPASADGKCFGGGTGSAAISVQTLMATRLPSDGRLIAS